MRVSKEKVGVSQESQLRVKWVRKEKTINLDLKITKINWGDLTF